MMQRQGRGTGSGTHEALCGRGARERERQGLSLVVRRRAECQNNEGKQWKKVRSRFLGNGETRVRVSVKGRRSSKEAAQRREKLRREQWRAEEREMMCFVCVCVCCLSWVQKSRSCSDSCQIVLLASGEMAEEKGHNSHREKHTHTQ